MSDVPLTEAAAEPKALDIQHDTDPAQDHGIAKRIPHLGHAILFFAIALLATVVCVLGGFTAGHLRSAEEILQHPGLAVGSQALGYVLTHGCFRGCGRRAFCAASSGMRWRRGGAGTGLFRQPWR